MTKIRLTKKQKETLAAIKKAPRSLASLYNKRVLDCLVDKGLVVYDILYETVSPVKETLCVLYDNYYSGGDIREGQGDTDWPDREDSYCSTDLYGVFTQDEADKLDKRFWRDEFEVTFKVKPNMTVHVVTVNYDTGDTFGRSCGHTCIESIYLSAAEAHKVASSIKDGSYNGYKAWDGYFEQFNYTEVHSFRLNELQKAVRY
jgi:hypothetical protein